MNRRNVESDLEQLDGPTIKTKASYPTPSKNLFEYYQTKFNQNRSSRFELHRKQTSI